MNVVNFLVQFMDCLPTYFLKKYVYTFLIDYRQPTNTKYIFQRKKVT